MKKEFDKIVRIRRSVRRYKKTEINDDDVKDSILHASLAPNSSNLQLWEFYHITSEELMNKISKACFDQPAARTANQFVVIVTRKDLWNERRIFNINFSLTNSEFMGNSFIFFRFTSAEQAQQVPCLGMGWESCAQLESLQH